MEEITTNGLLTAIINVVAELIDIIINIHNRLLIISTSNAVKQSKNTANALYKYIFEVNDKILLIGINETSNLNKLNEK